MRRTGRKAILNYFAAGILVLAGVLFFSPAPAKAAEPVSLPVETVEDVTDPALSLVGQDYSISGADSEGQLYSFTLEKAGKVRFDISLIEEVREGGIIFNLAYNTAGTNKIAYKNRYVSVDNNSPRTAEIYLDEGTYYCLVTVECTWDYYHKDQVHPAAGFHIAVGYEKSEDETGKTSMKSPKSIKVNSEVKGYFSEVRKEQYYKLSITKNNQLVTISAKANQVINDPYYARKYIVEVFDKNNHSLRKFSGQESMSYVSSKLYLNKGTYYIKLYMDDLYDDEGYRGDTLVKVAAVTKEPLTLKASTTKPAKKVVITVKTGTPADNIRWVKGKVSQKDINNADVWDADSNKNVIKKSITVTQNGTYSFRFRDKYDNIVIKTIKISNIQ